MAYKLIKLSTRTYSIFHKISFFYKKYVDQWFWNCKYSVEGQSSKETLWKDQVNLNIGGKEPYIVQRGREDIENDGGNFAEEWTKNKELRQKRHIHHYIKWSRRLE